MVLECFRLKFFLSDSVKQLSFMIASISSRYLSHRLIVSECSDRCKHENNKGFVLIFVIYKFYCLSIKKSLCCRAVHTWRLLEGPWVLNEPKAPGEFVIIGYKCLHFDWECVVPTVVSLFGLLSMIYNSNVILAHSSLLKMPKLWASMHSFVSTIVSHLVWYHTE